MDGLMTFCHDARKGRYIGSHWPNHVRASALLDPILLSCPLGRITSVIPGPWRRASSLPGSGAGNAVVRAGGMKPGKGLRLAIGRILPDHAASHHERKRENQPPGLPAPIAHQRRDRDSCQRRAGPEPAPRRGQPAAKHRAIRPELRRKLVACATYTGFSYGAELRQNESMGAKPPAMLMRRSSRIGTPAR